MTQILLSQAQRERYVVPLDRQTLGETFRYKFMVQKQKIGSILYLMHDERDMGSFAVTYDSVDGWVHLWLSLKSYEKLHRKRVDLGIPVSPVDPERREESR